MVITDQASYPQAFPLLAIRAGLAGGTDLWLNTGTDNWQIEGYDTNATVMTQLREASRHILFAVSRSLAMNGISSTAKVVAARAPWQTALLGIDAVAAIGAVAGVYALLKKGGHADEAQAEKPEGARSDSGEEFGE